jgi:protein ImuB
LAFSFHAITPSVSLESPDTVLLEVRDSLKLFGGIREIKNRVATELDKHGLSFRIGVAPTANGALWLVRDGPHEASTLADLTRRLRPLPLSVTAWPQTLQSRLKDMGISTVGDCLRLPRDGFARRIGPRYLRDLDKALGREIDLRKPIELPQRLAWKCELSFETADSGVILEAAEHMLEQLTPVLRQRQKQIQRFSFCFYYLHHESHTEVFELIEPTHEKQRILDLFSVRLERLRLPFPVVSIELRTGILKSLQIDSAKLFSNAAPMGGFGGMSPVLIERLRERLGPKSVHGFALEADHRPESAWRELSDCLVPMAEHVEQALSPWAGSRPLWLLPEPSRLATKRGKPFYGGPVQLREGPERIESGWWDHKDIKRDYYVALSKRGERLWIYFDRAERAWYLHGFFG